MFFDAITRLKNEIPGITFTTDIIVGFPGETDEMFEETREFVKKCGFLYVHIFPYSKREGTDAAVMPEQIPPEIKKRRASELKKTMLETRSRVLSSFNNKNSTVIFEEYIDGFFYGHTEHFIEVKYKSDFDESLIGKIITCKLIYDKTTTDYMLCEI